MAEKEPIDNVETVTGHASESPETGSLNLPEDDVVVMAQMGIKQQLKRRFNSISILALSVTLLSSWEAIGSTFGAALYAGGPVALIWGFMLTGSGTLALAASIAEMASMCPISGAQYHWTYMFAPPKWKVPITFVQGWVTVFAWQATITSLTFVLAAQIQGLVVLNWPTYIFERWHTTLMMWLLLLITYIINVWGIRIIPATELFAGICHVLIFLALFVTMLVLGRNASPSFVFTSYINTTGWSNPVVAWFIGLTPCVWCIIGFDGAIHLSEETIHAAKVIPRIILTTVLLNGTLAWVFLIVTLFGISDISAVLATPTGFPIIEVFAQITKSATSATVMEAALVSIGIAAMFGTLASVSRLTWAFARDDGLPFSSFFKKVDSRLHVPIPAITLVAVVIFLLSFINIASSVALNAILSLSTIALYVSYIIPIACLLSMRLRVSTRSAAPGEACVKDGEIVFGPFTLGRWGVLINLYAVCYASLLVPFMALPTSLPLTYQTMNYAGPVFCAVLVFAGLDYIVRGRFSFVGPRKEVG
ncbi:amino acid transporter [Aulographum hederae CBS 113979]|uniref:Amino acid transporter n=1 Tax=Aulographum hederae CBS 113979 TaxID=1176131 RepID=A0A6G1HHK5_9PEZI|nr:amino acid transporter [Aulographum hederae CBS 113979]